MVAKQTEQKTIYKTVDKNTQKHTRYTPDTKIM